MLDERDLQAIAQLMQGMETRIDQKMQSMETRIDQKMQSMETRIDQKMQSMETRIDQKMQSMKTEILDEATHRMKVLLDTEVRTKFNLLAEGQQDLADRLDRLTARVDALTHTGDRLDVLESVVKTHSVEIEALKKAN